MHPFLLPFWSIKMQFWATVLLDGLTYASYLFIVSLGLTIIFGVMKILNVAHGSFYAWGAYTSAFAIGFITDNDLSEALFLPAILISAILVGVVLGYVIERFILRKMYNQDIHLIVLATFGVFLIFEDLIIITFGVDPYLPYQPAMMLGWVDIVGLNRGVYQLTLILLASSSLNFADVKAINGCKAKIKNNPIIETIKIGGVRIFQIEIPLERKITSSELLAIL